MSTPAKLIIIFLILWGLYAYLKRGFIIKKTSTMIVVFVLILASLFLYINKGPIYGLNELTAEYIPFQETPENLVSLRAEDCGVCHQEIYEEWKTTLHANAYNDRFFVAYHKKDNFDPTCFVCHTPLTNQLDRKVTYKDNNYNKPILTKNPDFDPKLRDEGVTCAACHVRNGIVYGPYKRDELNAPHPVKYGPKFRNKDVCLDCHQVKGKTISFTPSGMCSTDKELLNSPASQNYNCQYCHMEKVYRPLMAGFPARESRKHTWPGGYSNEHLAKALSFKAQPDGDDIIITITNTGAGHKVPTGDPDRVIELYFYWHDDSSEKALVKKVTFKRVVIWLPVIFDFADYRLAAGESFSFAFTPEKPGRLSVEGFYNVMTDKQYQRLVDHYDLTGDKSVIRRNFTNQDIEVKAPSYRWFSISLAQIISKLFESQNQGTDPPNNTHTTSATSN